VSFSKGYQQNYPNRMICTTVSHDCVGVVVKV